MKTKIQKERDEKTGVIGLTHSFDSKSGKIIAKGTIHQVIDPEVLVKTKTLVTQKLDELKNLIGELKKQYADMHYVAGFSKETLKKIEDFIEIQKLSAEVSRLKSLEEQIKSREKEYEVLLDDWAEQEKLLEEYLEWKKVKK